MYKNKRNKLRETHKKLKETELKLQNIATIYGTAIKNKDIQLNKQADAIIKLNEQIDKKDAEIKKLTNKLNNYIQESI